MPAQQESPALEVARALVEAWSRKDWDAARSMLAPDVRVIAMTTALYPPPADLTGAEEYMKGLVRPPGRGGCPPGGPVEPDRVDEAGDRARVVHGDGELLLCHGEIGVQLSGPLRGRDAASGDAAVTEFAEPGMVIGHRLPHAHVRMVGCHPEARPGSGVRG